MKDPGGDGVCMDRMDCAAVAEPVRIKVYATSANVELPDDIQTQPLVQALQEKTNVILDVEFFDTGKYRDMVNMKFAAGGIPMCIRRGILLERSRMRTVWWRISPNSWTNMAQT